MDVRNSACSVRRAIGVAAALGAPILLLAATPSPKAIQVPGDMGEWTLPARAEAQRKSAAALKVPYAFRFTDRQTESGITFRHRNTDDSGKFYRPNHYDHGNGLAVADVDGDGLVDVYFVNQLGPNELWKNVGGGKFQNITERAGVGFTGRVSVAASFADTDNDGDQDLYVTTVRAGNVFFENDGTGRFRDISRESGLAYVGHSSGATFFDYDRDGRLDLFLANIGRYTTDEKGRGGYFIGYTDAFAGHLFPERSEQSILFRNLGGNRFEDVSRQTGLVHAGFSGDASIADFNEDGFPDLYVLDMQGDDRYYENDGGKRFIEKGATYFPRTPWGAMGIKVFDFDNDGRTDLFLTDMHSDMSENIGPEREKLKSRMQWKDGFLQGGANNIFGNAFYRNLGGGKFEEVSDRLGVENYWPWGPSVDDVNADGWDDIFIAASMCYPFRYGINSLLLNNAGKSFVDAEFLVGVEPRRDNRYAATWFEVDCGTEGAGQLACEGQTGLVKVVGAVGSRSAAIFDLDGDGDLDIVTGEFNAHPQVLVSDLAQRGPIRWVKVKLVGSRSNRSGLGARVRVVTGRRSMVKTLDGKSGHLSQSAMPLYFGLGTAKTINSIEVRWPSGARSLLRKGLTPNTTIEIRER